MAPSATSTTAPGGGALIAIAPIPAADRSPAGTAGTAPDGHRARRAGRRPRSRARTSSSARERSPSQATASPSSTSCDVLLAQRGPVVMDEPALHLHARRGTVIPGWDKGVVGMKVGGRRELIIPPSLGYKDTSPGPGIAPNDTLVFVVDLLKIN